jgi:hypothetical protein
MKKIYVISIALITLFLAAASASAAIERNYDNGESAYAYWSSTNENGNLNVYEASDYGTFIDVYFYGTDANGVYHDIYGGTQTNSDVFNIENKRLSSASLSEISIPVQDSYYDPILGEYVSKYTTLTVKLDWTGVDSITKDKSTTKSHDYIYTSTGARRNAIVTGSVIMDGKDILSGATSSGSQISNYKTVSVTKISV